MQESTPATGPDTEVHAEGCADGGERVQGQGHVEHGGEHHQQHAHHRRVRTWLRKYALPLASGVLCAGVAWVLLDRSRRRRKRGLPGALSHVSRQQWESVKGEDGEDRIQIPLQDVVRFKERQWFIEEVENSRHGDANAMLRLAKMHLHGQGCDQNLPMAQEWLRKARYMGIFATLDEIWAGEPGSLRPYARPPWHEQQSGGQQLPLQVLPAVLQV